MLPRSRLRPVGNAGRVCGQLMTRLLTICLCWLAGWVFAVPAPLSHLERVSIGGHEYVRLGDWASANRLAGGWLSKQEWRLTNGPSHLSFTVNSTKLGVNGITVWLSAPVACVNGAAYVASVDLQATVQPLLWPGPARARSRAPLICLDPGHGGKDTGNLEGKKLEKEYTLALARELAAQLRKAGYKVCQTRSWDTFIELDERAELARRRGADLFVSLHFNSAPGTPAKGAELYCLTPPRTASTNARGEGANTGSLPGNQQNEQNILLAFQLQKMLVQRLGLDDRGVRRARWAVLKNARMPAVLVEGGFMSNAAESKKIDSAAWRRELASALTDGIRNYQRLSEPKR